MNSFYIISNESESSVFPLIQTFPDLPIIKDFSNTKLNYNDTSRLLQNKLTSDQNVTEKYGGFKHKK